MKIMVMDGQGGGIGRLVVEKIKKTLPACQIIAVGTNALATSAMMKAGASAGATGENAVIFNSQNCDIIIGPVGIVMPNAMLGELSPKMAKAIARSPAQKILISVNKCHIIITDELKKNVVPSVEEAVERLRQLTQA